MLDLPGVPVKIHESRRFGPADIYTINPPFVVSPGRALVDAAAWTRSPLQASRIIVAGVQQRLVSPSELIEELDRAGKVRHHRMLRQVMHDVEGGARALSEVEFLRFCRRHRLPIPELNVRTTANGKRRYLDAVFRLPDGRVLRVEIDGGIHLTFDTHIADTLRDNDLFLAGAGGGLRFASASIYADDPRAVRQLRQALGLVRSA